MGRTRNLGSALIFMAMVAGVGVAAGAGQPSEEDGSDSTAEASDPCYWTGWGCGVMGCTSGYSVTGIDFNITRSEGCWGSGNDYDEPFRRVECCDVPSVTGDCYWTAWGCGALTCAGGYYTNSIDFNINRSEGCWGSGNDYDEPFRRIQCCRADTPPTSCYWTSWGCGETVCPNGYAVSGVDFNATQSEGCWGSGNDYDEPSRRVLCCTQ